MISGEGGLPSVSPRLSFFRDPIRSVSSEYDPVFGPGARDRSAEEDLARVRAAFRRASRPYLSSSVPWFTWAALFPAAALATGRANAVAGAPGVLGLWSVTVLAGGLVEGSVLLAARRRFGATALGAWVMRVQGNLSLVGAVLSVALALTGREALLPALWLLVLGHSLFAFGGLALPAQRIAGIVYQAGGVAALVPGVPPLTAFAVATAAGNLIVAFGVLWRRTDAGAASQAV